MMMTVATPIRHCLLALLVLIQPALDVSAAVPSAMPMDNAHGVICLDYENTHCDLLTSSGQARVHCGSSACVTFSIIPDAPSPVIIDHRMASLSLPLLHPAPRAGYRNPLERPPNH